jgi:heptosyltransferase-3
VNAFASRTRNALLYVKAASKSFRRNGRLFLGRFAAQMFAQRTFATHLSAERISTVLVVRINGRLGNALFLTPLIERIHELFPDAAIDLAMAYPQAPVLLKNQPGVRRIIAFPHKGVGMIWNYFAAMSKVRSEHYDIVIDPSPESTSGRIVLALTKATHRIGFATASQWAPLTHAAKESPELMHQGVQPVFLLCNVLGKKCDPRDVRLSLSLKPDELDAGRSAIARALAKKNLPPGSAKSTFGFFAHATGSKTLEKAWWQAFWKAFLELEPEAVPVEFLPSPTSAPTEARFASLNLPSTRDLTAAIATTRMFISADTGPMHLASATPVPTVGLFKTSHPKLYGPLKSNDLVIDARDCPPWLAAQLVQAAWRDSATASGPISAQRTSS